MVSYNWQCPFCKHHVVITDERRSVEHHSFNHGNTHGLRRITTKVHVCPNEQCKEFTLFVGLEESFGRPGLGSQAFYGTIKSWRLIPDPGVRMTIPDYVPGAIREDYKEACLIHDLSPKASATLSRRCLQGMIRDFWDIRKARLKDEIQALEEIVSPSTWAAIDAVREIGNVGAHMEKDVNVIVEVEPEEAELLLQLIETLIGDWYVDRHEKEARNAALREAAERKKKRAESPEAHGEEDNPGG